MHQSFSAAGLHWRTAPAKRRLFIADCEARDIQAVCGAKYDTSCHHLIGKQNWSFKYSQFLHGAEPLHLALSTG